MAGRRVIVVGAGPCGLAAALAAVRRGLDVTVLEQGRVGDSLRRWGPTRLFSPLAMNLPPGAELAGLDPEAILDGHEFVRLVLEPIAATLPVITGARVIAIGRAGRCRGDQAGHPLRAERPFRVLIDEGGAERWLEAEAVLDATGVSVPAAIGAGGLVAPGERARSGAIRDLGALDAARPELAGQALLLVGHGHSAAHAIGVLAAVAREAPSTRVTWAVRTPNQRPCVEVASDPLPERQRVVAEANALAAAPPPWLRVERRASVERLTSATATLSGDRTVAAARVIALTGYRPDASHLAELPVELSPVTEGAARLTRALAAVTDCLSVPSVAPADLASGEPGFHLIGARSYGRARTFLLRTGYAQIETIVSRL